MAQTAGLTRQSILPLLIFTTTMLSMAVGIHAGATGYDIGTAWATPAIGAVVGATAMAYGSAKDFNSHGNSRVAPYMVGGGAYLLALSAAYALGGGLQDNFSHLSNLFTAQIG